jgi:hypothetical protein
MASPITGKVAAIEDNYSVVINRGSVHNVKKGMIFVIEDPKGKEIVDPDDPEEILGHLPVEKIKVKVSAVLEKLCRAETFVRVKPESAYETAARELLNEYRMLRNFPAPHQMGYPFRTPPEAEAKLQQALRFLQMGGADRATDERPAVVEVNIGDIARQVG